MEQLQLEIRSASAPVLGDGSTVTGLAVVYNSLSSDLGGFREIILPGSATDSLAKRDILALYAHKSDQILGRTSSGTLSLREDTAGVHYSLNLPKTQLGNDLRELIGRGDIKGASFGFSVPDGGERWNTRDGQRVRELSAIDIGEITLTAIPAYEATTAALRSLQVWDEKLKRMMMKVRLANL